MMISVCIATYNGAQYVEQQILSILDQLSIKDEIIIVDDCSTDRTLGIIKTINDSRIKIHENKYNLGVATTFGRAMSLAKGDIIFTADQDDLWYDNKVQSIVNLFNMDKLVTLIITDTKIIDGDNIVVTESYFKKRGGFKVGFISNMIKNKYLGCTMAFKPEMRKYILPFPNKIPSHDMWIGLMNSLYGEIRFIDIPLMGYRRHGENVSPIVHQSIWKIIIWRLIFIYRLLQRAFKILFEKSW
mgnify:FL=1